MMIVTGNLYFVSMSLWYVTTYTLGSLEENHD